MEINDCLFIIPARGGSKGLPKKNILEISGKPIICYSIDAARAVTSDRNICVSTDSQEIASVVEEYGLVVPFLRPPELSTDTAGSREVIIHAIETYRQSFNRSYNRICLLQPTSPFRTGNHLMEAFKLWDDELDMLVSVKESKSNPYFNLFELNAQGYLGKSKYSAFTRRQDVPQVYEYNGAIYIIKTSSIIEKSFSELSKVKPYLMNSRDSVDIDTPLDYELCKLISEKKL